MKPPLHISKRGLELLRDPHLNKGLAFTLEERRLFGLEGYLPAQVRNLEQQVQLVREYFHNAQTPTAQYEFLRGLQESNETLFFAFCRDYLEEVMPILYVPTVATVVEEFSSRWHRPRGIYLTPDTISRAEEILDIGRPVQLIIATDNQGVLGLGDQGAGGMALCYGKAVFYSLSAGIDPAHILPVSLDVGTDNWSLLSDPDYLGYKAPRLTGEAYSDFLELFARAVKRRHPEAIVQWEDFSRQNAFAVLEKYRDFLVSFSDDIQGSGAVSLAAILSGLLQTHKTLSDATVVIYGNGLPAVGLAQLLVAALIGSGVAPDTALSQILLVDAEGILTDDRPHLPPYLKRLAQSREAVVRRFGSAENPSLLEILRKTGAGVLVGTADYVRVFGESVVRQLARNVDSPILLLHSTPLQLMDAFSSNISEWTRGRCFCTATFPASPAEYNGRRLAPSLLSNTLICPGIALGLIAARARTITDGMFIAGAQALAAYAAQQHPGQLLPPISALPDSAQAVAQAVAFAAAQEKTAHPHFRPDLYDPREGWWTPVYRDYSPDSD